MKFGMFGMSHRTAPVEIRERFTCDAAKTERLLQRWVECFGDYEFVPVFTCNRTELYFASENGSLPTEREIFDFLCDTGNNPDHSDWEKNRSFFSMLTDSDSVSHLFRVASSLESMVIGEPQILSQVKTAYRIAAESGTTGPITHSAFQTALKTAKRISTETELFHHRVSIPSVAVVDFALNLFERLSDKKTVVWGAGEMARETVQYLVENGAKTITIVNRSPEKAEMLASEFSAVTERWEDRDQSLNDADILIAATGADHFILDQITCRDHLARRPGKPLFLLDLCVPRNIDPRCAELSNVFLYSIDDLQEACDRNRTARDLEIPKSQRIVQQETERFFQEMRRRDSGVLIRQLRQTWNDVKEEELKRLFNKCSELDEKSISEIRYAFDRLVNKLLHPPMESLKDESMEAKPGRLVEAMKRLFRL